MSDTLVIQSHRQPLPLLWIRPCLDSVQNWAELNHFDYRFIGDDLFDSVPDELLHKTAQQRVVATDLGRLHALQNGLQQDYQTIIWCDADFLIFDPEQFILPESKFALGREVWIQQNSGKRLRAYRKVHNAFLLFRQGNSFLDFYADTAERLLRLNAGSMPPQFIGPKLLTALHNIAICPVLETAGMLSPLVIKDLLSGGGSALDLFRQKSTGPIYAANLSGSLVEREMIDDTDMFKLIEILGINGIDKSSSRSNQF
jgi:hypothetical protein